MTSITAIELKKSIAAKEDFLLIDVREDFEHEHFNIGGILMPMGTILQNIQKIPTDKRVIFYCEKGILRIYAHPEYQLIVDYSNDEGEFHKVGEIPTNIKQVKSGIVDLFVESILTNRKPEISGEEGYKALNTVMACFKAIDTKKVVTIQ